MFENVIKMKFKNQVTFREFLSGIPARDYIFQNEEYDRQIERAAMMIQNADYVLVGAGAGLSEEKIFCTQGDYFHIQCAKGCHPKIYDSVEMFRQMNQARKDCKMPAYMVPKCPVCGGAMTMNLRSDTHFVEDDAWHKAEERFGEFISEMLSDRNADVVLLELGVGFNTPTIIRFPFEKLTREHENISLIRLNLNEAIVPESFGTRAVGINADMKNSIEDMKERLK